jgi:hypothetical protein
MSKAASMRVYVAQAAKWNAEPVNTRVEIILTGFGSLGKRWVSVLDFAPWGSAWGGSAT